MGITFEGLSCHSSDPSKGKKSIDRLYEVLEKVYRFPYLKDDPDIGVATVTTTTIKTWSDYLHTAPAFTRLVLAPSRLVPGEDPKKAMTEIKEYLMESSSDIKMSFDEELNFQYPHKIEENCPLVQSAKKACQRATGKVETSYNRSALDMGFFSHYEQDCITFGPGDSALAHSDYEMVPLSEFYEAAYIYEILLEDMFL